MLNISEIEKRLRHKYPFLLIDRVEYVTDNKAKGIKCVTINEPFFKGHFPGEPVMPGVLIVEAMAQLSAIIAARENRLNGVLTGIYNARFIKPVVPGDKLIIESEVVQTVKNLIRVKATAKVSDQLVAKAELGFIVFDSTLQVK